jgi:putative oxidoreductase
MKFSALGGRLLFSAVFLVSVASHFKAAEIQEAAQHGVPAANLLVPAAGILALIGGLSVALGFYARAGAAMLVLFLVPVTLMMHAFWAETDPQMAQTQMWMFMKNLSMMGAALYIIHFGSGPVSLDNRRSATEPSARQLAA